MRSMKAALAAALTTLRKWLNLRPVCTDAQELFCLSMIDFLSVLLLVLVPRFRGLQDG